MASLFVVRGRDQGKHFPLKTGVYSIGREADNRIQLMDQESSRRHAELRLDSDRHFLIVDLNSSNGTRVNGRRIQSEPLSSGDRIEIGGTLLIFTGSTQPTAVEAAHSVDIVDKSQEDGSRIVSSLSHSNAFPDPLDVEDVASHPPRPNDSDRRTEADRSLEVMYLTAIAVGRTDDLSEVLERVLRLVFDWVEADRGCVMLKDQATGQLKPAARCDSERGQSGRDHEAGKQKPISISQTILQYVLEQKEGVRTSNARDDARFGAAASIVQAGVREALCVPLQGRYGIVGALYIDTYTPPGQLLAQGIHQRFTDDHLRLITAIGHQAALAIEDTTYYSALLQSERLAVMGQTIATLSHHIKNILQGISGGSYLIEAGLQRDDTDAVRRGWGIVDRNQERISNLVMDMLTFSKEREPEKVDTNLNDAVRDVIELMQSRAQEFGVELTSELSNDQTPAYCDPDAIHRAVLNLVTNAIDAAGGKLGAEEPPSDTPFQEDSDQHSAKAFIRTKFDREIGWTIDVIDNGPGIAPEDQGQIFSLFESSKGMRGTGLGLPVTAKIMREHQGDISIVETDSKQGTCFRLTLPPKPGDQNVDVDSPTLA